VTQDEQLIGSEVHGHVLASRYTEWQQFENGGRAARFKDERGRKVLVLLTPLANGDEMIEGFRIG
jgi:hypothetical protein